jgi:type II secretory pathway pseudopilin PulG
MARMHLKTLAEYPQGAGPGGSRFWYHLAMNFTAFIAVVTSVISAALAYLVTTLIAQRSAAKQTRALAEAVAALENEKTRFDEVAKAIEENTKRKALDEFLADLHIEERHYLREHRVLFVHRKSLVLQERIFFRNVPLSNWVEHEIPVEEGADLDALAKTLSLFDAVDAGTSIARSSRALLFSKR